MSNMNHSPAEWETCPGNNPQLFVFLLLSEANFFLIANHSHVRGKKKKSLGNHLNEYEKAQHKVYMLSMWFPFQQFGLCMPFSDSVQCSYIKTSPLKPQRIYCDTELGTLLKTEIKKLYESVPSMEKVQKLVSMM